MPAARHALAKIRPAPPLPVKSTRSRDRKRVAINRLRESDTESPQILYETAGLLGIFKPAGYAIQGDGKRPNAQKWADYVSILHKAFGPVYAVDRLDSYTSGAYLFARNRTQSHRLSELFAKASVPKTFLAIVYGDLPHRKAWNEASDIMLSDASIGKRMVGHFRVDDTETRRSTDPDEFGARECINDMSIIESSSDDRFHLIRIEPRSTMKHGLRAQLATQLKSPVVGDYKYARIEEHPTFHWLKYEGTFSMALHCLDITLPRFINRQGAKRVRIVDGVYAEPSDLFEETLRKVGITALDEGLVRFGGPRGLFKPNLDTDTALASSSKAATRIESQSSKSLSTRKTTALATVGKPREAGVSIATADEKRRSRMVFDPDRRAREAFDPSSVERKASTSVLSAPREHDKKVSREVAAVRSKRMDPGKLVGMIELRRRRRAVKLAVARGADPGKLSRPSAGQIRRKPRFGMSREYTPMSIAPSPKAIRKAQQRAALKAKSSPAARGAHHRGPRRQKHF